MKKGDRVEFKTPSGKVVKGIYEGKEGTRAIIKGGKKTYKPPLKLVKKSKEEPKKGKVQIINNGQKSYSFDTIKEATDHIQKKFRSNDFRNLRIYDKMEKALAEGRDVGFKVKFMLSAEKTKREEAGKDKPSDDYVNVTPYYTNPDGSTTDTRKTIAKVMDTRKYKVDPSLLKERKSDLKLKS